MDPVHVGDRQAALPPAPVLAAEAHAAFGPHVVGQAILVAPAAIAALRASGPMLPQMIVFETTFLVLAVLNAGFYALMASMARSACSCRFLTRAATASAIRAGA